MVAPKSSEAPKRSGTEVLADLERLATELESVLRRLRREANSPYSRELDEDRQVGKPPHALDATDP
jgi:hypothetical protein